MSETVTQAVAQRETGVLNIIKANQTKIAPVLPNHIDVETFVGLATGALFRDPKLMQAATNNPGAMMNALMRCASLGHQPGTEEFYLVPRRNKKNRNLPEIQGIEGYRGIVERMYRSGAVASVIVREVCAHDQFRYVEGEMDRPKHSFGATEHATTGAEFFGAAGRRDRGDMVGVYAYAILTTGAVSRVVLLDKDDVMAAKAAGDGGDSDYSPWNRLDAGIEHPELRGRSMWWKTAARRLEPWVPTSAQYRLELARAAAEAYRGVNAPKQESPADAVPPVSVFDGELAEPQPVTGGDDWPAVAEVPDADR